jgi:hypothetical protein
MSVYCTLLINEAHSRYKPVTVPRHAYCTYILEQFLQWQLDVSMESGFINHWIGLGSKRRFQIVQGVLSHIIYSTDSVFKSLRKPRLSAIYYSSSKCNRGYGYSHRSGTSETSGSSNADSDAACDAESHRTGLVVGRLVVLLWSENILECDFGCGAELRREREGPSRSLHIRNPLPKGTQLVALIHEAPAYDELEPTPFSSDTLVVRLLRWCDMLGMRGLRCSL